MEILGRKITTTKDDEEYIDLTYQSVKYESYPYISGIYAVDEQAEMRPDIASKSVYGIDDSWDMILKFNGISNPFSLCKDDRLFIPSLIEMKQNLVDSSSSTTNAQKIRNQYIDVSKKAQTDSNLAALEKKRKDALKKKGEESGTSSVNNLPPNIAEEGDREVSIEGGRVVFGPNVSKGLGTCDNTMSKSDFVASLIKNRLNK